jgi:hypothetical protein
MLNAQGQLAFTLTQLKRAWRATKVDQLAEHGIVITELNPIASQTGDVPTEKEEVDAVCASTMQHAIEIGTSVIVAFGDNARQRWKKVGQLVPGATGVDDMHKDVISFFYQARQVTVFTSVHPCNWSKFDNVVTSIVRAHLAVDPFSDVVVPDTEKLFATFSFQLCKPVEVTDGPYEIARMKVTGNHRFLLANGVVTHNCIECQANRGGTQSASGHNDECTVAWGPTILTQRPDTVHADFNCVDPHRCLCSADVVCVYRCLQSRLSLSLHQSVTIRHQCDACSLSRSSDAMVPVLIRCFSSLRVVYLSPARWLRTRPSCPLDNEDWAFQKYSSGHAM